MSLWPIICLKYENDSPTGGELFASNIFFQSQTTLQMLLISFLGKKLQNPNFKYQIIQKQILRIKHKPISLTILTRFAILFHLYFLIFYLECENKLRFIGENFSLVCEKWILLSAKYVSYLKKQKGE